MERTITYKITDSGQNIRIDSFLRKHGYSMQNLTLLKKMPESILKNGEWSYMQTTLQAGDILTVRIQEETSSPNIPAVNLPIDIVYEDEDNIHIIYDTDRYTLPNMQDLKLVLSATRDDEQIPVMPLVETIQKYACSLSGTERARCQIILDAINQHGMKVSRKELRHILNLKSNLGKQINRFIFEESGVLIGNALKSARNKEALFGGVLGIRHFCKDDAQYYYSGYLGKSINRSFPHACRIRKVCSTGQTLQFQRYLPLLEVDFIRANGWTVIPFPFKYLREWRLQQG